jgi:hypothetical protein
VVYRQIWLNLLVEDFASLVGYITKLERKKPNVYFLGRKKRFCLVFVSYLSKEKENPS